MVPMFKGFMQRVDRLLGRGVIDERLYDELEEALLQADASVTATHEILEDLRRSVRSERITDPAAMKARLQQAIADRFEQADAGLAFRPDGPTLVVFVGVNGVGKTTTIAKLAHLLKSKGHSVLLAAGDTFRAAAVEQLEVWAKRVGCDIIKSRPGADAGAVVFDAIQAAKARGIDYVLADTAGRQHSKANLMLELQKIVKVAEKALGRRPDEVLLVLDANTGQNAVRQAEEFIKHTGVTGLVLTKLDGTSRGGALIGINSRFRVPIKFIGVGERLEDLEEFRAREFARRLFE